MLNIKNNIKEVSDMKQRDKKADRIVRKKKTASNKIETNKKITERKAGKSKNYENEPESGTIANIQETKESKMEAFYYNVSSLEKSAMDPKGTMLIAKYKQHEIGIHVDPKLSSLLFSYYPREGKGEMINIPISIKDIISFISQKAS